MTVISSVSKLHRPLTTSPCSVHAHCHYGLSIKDSVDLLSTTTQIIDFSQLKSLRMASIRFIVLWIAVLAGAANAWRWFRSTLPEGVELGDSCTVSRPWRCGERVLLNATETELTEDDGFDG